jgi:cytochrome P450
VVTEINFMSADFRADPYPTYALLRDESPVREAPGMGMWTVARYDDVAYVLRNHALFSSKAMGAIGTAGRTIINTDPPEHTDLRGVVNRVFTPRMVADLEPRIRQIARELLDEAVAQREFDLVRDLAIPLPVTIIAEILGVDPARRADFKRWSNALVGVGPDEMSQGRQPDLEEFRDYFQRTIDERRRSPRGDLISALVAAEENHVKLSPDEVLAFAALLLIAGNETTTNLIGNAMLALFDHPDQMALVRKDSSLIPNMIEEALRWDSPVQFLFRVTTQDVEIGGQPVRAGAMVVPMYASGNRDERKFPDAERFDITRNTQGHLAFGLGVHFCLGAPLARLEARVVFEELFGRFGEITRIGESAPKRIDSLFLRGLRSLPVACEPARV